MNTLINVNSLGGEAQPPGASMNPVTTPEQKNAK